LGIVSMHANNLPSRGMNLPNAELIEDRIERAQLELKRLRLLLKMAKLDQPRKPKAGKEAPPPQGTGGRAK
jgi:hypothetical protein